MATTKMIAEKDGAVGRMIFNQPEKHNAVSLEMWEAAEEILDDFATDDAMRVVVVTGAGGKAFVSGADISKFESERSSMEAVEHYNAATARVYAKLDAFAKPTIAMIQGHCIGGGVAVAVCCDLRICSDNSRFAVPAARLGLGYGYAGIRRLMNIVGPHFTKEIFFTARRFDAGEAKDMGLVNRVVAEADLEAYVADYAETIAGNAPLTVASIKRIVGEAVKDPAERDLEACERLVKECFASADYIEGRRAFMEKRKPQFVGR
jgi:enoyl-CoA hydratase/carnithine racemase